MDRYKDSFLIDWISYLARQTKGRVLSIARLFVAAVLSCVTLVSTGTVSASDSRHLRIASAQTAADTGVLDVLIDDFRKEHPDVIVEVKAVGAITALDYGRNGQADLVITHSPTDEKIFIDQGFGVERTTFMYDEFAIAGPPNDPLKLSLEKDLVKVLQRLAKAEVDFYAPGKRSGTVKKLDSLWALAGIEPNWPGYEVTGTSSRATLEDAGLFQAYTFVDMGTYQVMRESIHDQVIPLYRDNALLRNYYSGIVVSQERVPTANQPLAKIFLEYLESDRAQGLIRSFGDTKFGAQIFVPCAAFDEGLQARRAQDAIKKQTRNLAILSGLCLLFTVAAIIAFSYMKRARKLEKIRRRSEERFALAVAGSNDGIFDWDILKDSAFFSGRLNQILGMSAADTTLQSPRAILEGLIHSDDVEKVTHVLNDYLKNDTKGSFLSEFRIRRKNGDLACVLMRGKAIRGPLGDAVRLSGSLTDVTDRKRQEAQLEHQALHDSLTGLPNRTLLHDRLVQAVQHATRHQLGLALIVMDLNRFKEINDTLGHPIGDQILKEVTARLQQVIRPTETVARLGGDEFAVLLPEADPTYANHVAQKILLVLKHVFDLGRHNLYIGATIGVAMFPEHGDNAETLTRHADVAMYNAQRVNSDVAFYNPDQDTHSVARLALEKDLQDAITNDALTLHYQPIFNLHTGELQSVEALLRWTHPEHGVIAPDRIIAVAEETGLIKPLTKWVLNTAIYQCYDWQRKGINTNIAINLSVWNLHDPDLVDVVKDALRILKIPAAKLEFELTESAMMADPERAIAVLNDLHKMGIRIVVDDFGTGFSSLAYLKKLPVDTLKIDKSFVIGMSTDEDDAMIVRSTIDLAHSLRLKVVAEGIETEEAQQRLQEWGCDLGQGYYLGKPMLLGDLFRLLQTTKNCCSQ